MPSILPTLKKPPTFFKFSTMTKTDKRINKENIKEATYYVKGMHCASCELIIEKELLKNEDIESVEASNSSSQVTVFYKGRKPSEGELNQKFKDNGYTFFQKPLEEEKSKAFISFNEKGQILVNKEKLFQNTQVLVVALLFMIGFLFLDRTGLASRIVVSSASVLPAFFVFGLMAGFSSCAALVGGVILSMSKQWSEIYEEKDSDWQRLQPHLLFNLGRLVSFGFLGALLGTLGAFLQLSLTATSLLAAGVSLMMIFLAFQMLGIKSFQKFQPAIPKLVSRFVADETHFKGRYMPFVLGALTFFLPCGFTITAQGLALAAGSSLRGALVMFSFALGTLPTLAAIGLSSLKLTAKPHLSARFLKVAGILVLFFGIYNLNAQLNVFGLPSLNDLKFDFLAPAQIAEDGLAPIVNGKQVLRMDALAYGYEPNEFKVREGIPVRWEITNKGVSGCTNAVISKGLFSGEIRLDKKTAVKEFTPQKPGRYKFSCWMGMISGTISVVGQDGAGGKAAVIDEEIPSGARGCGCGGGCGGGCGNPACPYAR